MYAFTQDTAFDIQIVIEHYSAWVKERQKGLDDAVKKANGYQDFLPIG